MAAGPFERALQTAAFGAVTGFAGASGALAEYIDPDDVSHMIPASLCCKRSERAMRVEPLVLVVVYRPRS